MNLAGKRPHASRNIYWRLHRHTAGSDRLAVAVVSVVVRKAALVVFAFGLMMLTAVVLSFISPGG